MWYKMLYKCTYLLPVIIHYIIQSRITCHGWFIFKGLLNKVALVFTDPIYSIPFKSLWSCLRKHLWRRVLIYLTLPASTACQTATWLLSWMLSPTKTQRAPSVTFTGNNDPMKSGDRDPTAPGRLQWKPTWNIAILDTDIIQLCTWNSS